MHRRLAHLVFTLLVLVPLVAFAATSAPSPPAPHYATCTVWTWTDYFSDAAKTNRVGYCSVTCFQATHALADPTFGGGGTCSGTSGPYTTKLFTACAGICP